MCACCFFPIKTEVESAGLKRPDCFVPSKAGTSRPFFGFQTSGGKLAVLNPVLSRFSEQGVGQTQRYLGLEGAQEGHRVAGPTPRWGQSQPRPTRQEPNEAGLVNTRAGLVRSFQVLRNWPVHPAPASGVARGQDQQVPQLIISPVPCCAEDALS